eukprot:TRINITY_DN1334_c0_g1_i1.p1 TRINITY_DN1334_c0_g1~~TRINITY_DN1334_c0_g1_i1.p1  ORF type:complete len:271 (-),score=37.64 TRINITY_DN1334_c0_g1_i1:29-817(-)
MSGAQDSLVTEESVKRLTSGFPDGGTGHTVAGGVVADTLEGAEKVLIKFAKALQDLETKIHNGEIQNPFDLFLSKQAAPSTPAGTSTSKAGQAKSKRGKAPASQGIPLPPLSTVLSFASNLSVDQIKSLGGMVLMVLRNTPLPILLREAHRLGVAGSVVLDVLGALVRRDNKEIVSAVLIAALAAASAINKDPKDKTLQTALTVSRFVHHNLISKSKSKGIPLTRIVMLVVFLLYLHRIINPPRLTPNDVADLVKSTVMSKL